MSSELTPVPKGMCPAFYQFMGAGGQRDDSGEILMLKESAMTSNPTPDRPSDVEAAAERVRLKEAASRLVSPYTPYDEWFMGKQLCRAQDGRNVANAYAAQCDTIAQLTTDLAAARAEVEAQKKRATGFINDAVMARGRLHKAEEELKLIRSQAAAFDDAELVTEEWCRANGATLKQGLHARTWRFTCGVDVEFGEFVTADIHGHVLDGEITEGRVANLIAAIGGAK